MNCKSCGSPMSDDARFCTECGADNISEPKDNINDNAEIKENPHEEVVFDTADMDSTKNSTQENEQINSTEKSNAEEVVFDTATMDEPKSMPPEPEAATGSTEEPEPVDSTENKETVLPTIAPLYDEKSVEENTAQSSAIAPDNKQIKAPKRLTAGRAVGAFVISIFAVVFMLVFNITISTRIGLSSEIVRNTTKSMNAATALDCELMDGDSLNDYIYNNIDGGLISRSRIERKDLRAFLIDADFLGFAADKLADYSAYLIEGSTKTKPSLTSDDIVDFIKDNKSSSNKEFSYSLEKTDYDDIGSSLKNNGFDDAVSIDCWNDNAGFNLGNLHFLFSFITIGILFTIVLVLFVWIAIVLDKIGKHVMGYFGNIAIIGGAVTFLPSLIFIIGSASAVLGTGAFAMYASSKLLMPLALIAAATGLFEIVVGVIFKKIKKHLKKKESKVSEDNK